MLENVIAIANSLSEAHDWSDHRTRTDKARHSELAKRFGLEYLGHGISRAAFRIGDHVIKLGMEGDNRKEWGVWNKCRASPASELLSATLHISDNGRAIVQDYGGKTLADNEEETGEDALKIARGVTDKLDKALKGTGVRALDTHIWNIGTMGKVFDYGHFRI